MKLVPSFNMPPSVVSVTVDPTVCAIAIFNSFFDDPPNETTVTMLVFSLTLLRRIQNLPPASNAIGTLLSCSMNCWLSL